MSSVKESIKPSTSAPTLDLREIQATVLRQRPAPYFGTHLLFRVDDAESGRKFLRRLTPHVDSAASWWNADDAWLSMSRTGLVARFAVGTRVPTLTLLIQYFHNRACVP